MAIKFFVKTGKSVVETIELINKTYGSAAACIGGMLAFETEGKT